MIIEAITLLIPLWSANVLVNIFYFVRKKYQIPDYPLDGNRVWFDGRRIFGQAKTIFGLPVALLGGYLGSILVSSEHGLLLGLAVYLGAMVSGFLKRRLGISRGNPLYIIDQSDYLFTAYILLLLSGDRIQPTIFFIALGSTIPIHLLTNIIAFKLNIRETYW